MLAPAVRLEVWRAVDSSVFRGFVSPCVSHPSKQYPFVVGILTEEPQSRWRNKMLACTGGGREHQCRSSGQLLAALCLRNCYMQSQLRTLCFPALKVENLKIMETALKLLHIFGTKKDRSVDIPCNASVLQGNLFLSLSVTLI